MELITLPAKQRNYTYAQSTQISMLSGLIGHLRADMDSSGYGFYSTWTDFRRELKTDEFRAEIDMVINELRSAKSSNGILSNRFQMEKYCIAHPESAFVGNYTREYGFRVNTENFAYLLRLNPNKGDYNVYCYCYRRDWLDQHLRRAERGIRFITSDYKNLFHVADGEKVCVTDKFGDLKTYTARYIDDYHVEMDGPYGHNLYHICELAERFERDEVKSVVPLREYLPDACYSALDSECAVVILRKGEMGYYDSGIEANTIDEAKAIVDKFNKKMGVTKAQAAALKAGSLFGFDVPAANPAFYDSNGNPIKPKQQDKSDAR